MKRGTSIFLLLVGAWMAEARLPTIEVIRENVCRVSTTSQRPDYQTPWMPGDVIRGHGAGFVIDGKRVMTNAHVVSDARFITVEKEGDPVRYRAEVEHVAHDADLAVLRVEDERFFEGSAPFEFGGIPALESTVSVYGFPVGGERLSVTRGVVSRIDFQNYAHSAIDAHLVIQIDAAINPGNSGGPVLQDGRVVGVAFQGFRGDVAQNVGYMIPVPVIERFLTDIEDGYYDGYVDLGITWFNLQNPAQRRALGLEDGDGGVMVGSVASAGASVGVLEVGDVLLAIDGRPIRSDGFVELNGERVEMVEVVERKFKDDTVEFELLRDGGRKQKTVTLKGIWPYNIMANRYDALPRFVLFGGLVFQPLNRNFRNAYDFDNLLVRYFYENFVSDELYQDHPEVIVLSQVLADPVNTHFTDFTGSVVESINGRKIEVLEDVAEALSQEAEQYVIELMGDNRPLVLERQAVEAARERILQRYEVARESHLDDPLYPREIWEAQE